MRRIAAVLVLVLLAAALAVPAALLVTEPGTRWLARAAQRVLPLELAGVKGSLTRGIGVAALTYRSEDLQVQAADLAVDVDLRCLLRSVLCIRSLAAARVTLRSAAVDGREAAAPPWARLAELPSIEVRDGAIDELRWSSGEREEVLQELVLVGGVDGRALDLERLAVCHREGCVDVYGGIDTQGRWRIGGDVFLSTVPIRAEALVLPAAFALRAEGDTRTAQLELSAAGQDDSLSLTGELRYADIERARASLRLTGLGQLVPLLVEQSVYPLAGPLAIEVQRRPGEILPVLDLSQDLQGPDDALLPLAAQLVPQAEGLTVDGLTLGRTATPRLRASGFLAYADGASSRVTVELARWRIPPALGLAAGEVSGSAVLQGTLAELLQSWSVSASQLVLREGDRLWQIDGALRASGADRFPVGDLAVALRSPALDENRPLRFAYQRTAADAPARLQSTEPVAAGRLRFAALGATVVPGEPLELEVVADGDISTRLTADVALGDDGARVRVAPFDVAYAGERFAVQDGMTFSWKQQSRAFDLGPVCTAWQGSELCTEGGSVGADGELALRVRVDEAHSGVLGDMPYAMAARGQGAAVLAWRDWQPQTASLDFAFDDLALDPFVGSATAKPVRWERATLVGELDAAGVGRVDVLLSSRQLGELAAEIGIRDEQLRGEVRSSGLSLTAFRDLVPRWQIDGGTIAGDLRIDGPLAAPGVRGELALRDGALRIPALDLQLESLQLDAQIDGRRLALQGQALAGGGDLRMEARCCEEQSIEGLLIGARNRLQMDNGLDATISPSLDFSLSATQLTASGALTVHAGVFEHSGLEEGGIALSPDVRRLDVPEEPPKRFDLDLDLRTLIQPGFTLRSERIVATLAGDLRLLVPTNQPASLFGNLEVLGGELRAYGQALRLTDGDLGFVGDPLNPDLALSAEREIRSDNQRVGFRIRGTLEAPRFDLFSDPQRPDDVTLSYLLRGRAPDVGVSADGTAMALSLGASALNQSGVLAPLNELPGLSGVTLGAEGTDQDMAATISAYVGNRLYLSYGVGIYEPINALTARLYLRSRLWLEVVSRLENSFDLFYRFDIE